MKIPNWFQFEKAFIRVTFSNSVFFDADYFSMKQETNMAFKFRQVVWKRFLAGF